MSRIPDEIWWSRGQSWFPVSPNTGDSSNHLLSSWNFLNGEKENEISCEQWGCVCTCTFFPPSVRWHLRLGITEILPGNLHSRRKHSRFEEGKSFGRIGRIRWQYLLITKKQYDTWTEASNRLAMCLCCTSLPCMKSERSELFKIRLWWKRNREFWLMKKCSQVVFS